MVALGLMYEQGNGVKQDKAMAQELYDRAAAAGLDVEAEKASRSK